MKSSGPYRPRWTWDEFLVLLRVSQDPRAQYEDAAKELGRTIYAVFCKATKLGLVKELPTYEQNRD